MNLELLICFLYFAVLQLCSSFMYRRFELPQYKPSLPPSSKSVGEPLILTPLLQSKKFAQARKLSTVPPLLKNIVSNAGYFTVEKKYNSNLFFWFIRATRDDWHKVPLVLWLQGGPGCSSLFGLFKEFGPFYVAKNKLKRRKYAWTDKYNVLYIDQPVGTGYSFTNSSEGRINNQDKVADHLYEALVQFFQLYPELKKNKFYIAGESYAGKYVPSIGYRIHRLKMANKCDFNLKGLFIMSAFSDPLNMMYYSDFTYKIGLIDEQTKDEIVKIEEAARSYIHSGFYKMAFNALYHILDILLSNSEFGGLYNYHRENFFSDDGYFRYLQSSEIRKKIHVGNVSYYHYSDQVFDDFNEDILKSVKPWIEELLEHYPFAFVGGQFDVICAYTLVARALQKLQWSGAVQYSQAKRQILYDGNRTVGYYKVAGNLKDILFRRAGHTLPATQGRVLLNLLEKFINGKL